MAGEKWDEEQSKIIMDNSAGGVSLLTDYELAQLIKEQCGIYRTTRGIQYQRGTLGIEKAFDRPRDYQREAEWNEQEVASIAPVVTSPLWDAKQEQFLLDNIDKTNMWIADVFEENFGFPRTPGAISARYKKLSRGAGKKALQKELQGENTLEGLWNTKPQNNSTITDPERSLFVVRLVRDALEEARQSYQAKYREPITLGTLINTYLVDNT